MKNTLPITDEKDDFRIDDKFLDIIRNVEAGLITMKIELLNDDYAHYNRFLEQFYLSSNEQSPWNLMRKEALRVLISVILLPEIEKELKVELATISENLIIQKCKTNYHKLLMTGPFILGDIHGKQQNEERVQHKGKRQGE